MRKCDCAFLICLQVDYATATLRINFKKQRTAYFNLRPFTTLANSPQDLRGYWNIVHDFFLNIEVHRGESPSSGCRMPAERMKTGRVNFR